MSRILVLGGYGAFGGRLSRRLRDAGHEVIVAGRSLDKARRFCAGEDGPDPARPRPRRRSRARAASPGDRRRRGGAVPAGRALHVPRACIAAGVHYLDLADARDFVGADRRARRGGAGGRRRRSSPAPRACRLCRARSRAASPRGWRTSAPSRSRSASRTAPAPAPRRRRRSSPMSAGRSGSGGAGPGRPASAATSCAATGSRPAAPLPSPAAASPCARCRTSTCCPSGCRAGRRSPSAPAPIRGCKISASPRLARLVRWGLIRDLSRWRRWLEPARRLTAGRGSDRSAMSVRLFGTAGGRRLERRWTLIADAGRRAGNPDAGGAGPRPAPARRRDRGRRARRRHPARPGRL